MWLTVSTCHSEHDYIMATNRPHGPEEYRQRTFKCRPNERIRFKLKILEVSQMVNDIITIQFMKSDTQKRCYYDLRFINHFIKMNDWFYTSFPIMQVTFDARKVRPIGGDSNKHILTPFRYNGLEMRVSCQGRTLLDQLFTLN